MMVWTHRHQQWVRRMKAEFEVVMNGTRMWMQTHANIQVFQSEQPSPSLSYYWVDFNYVCLAIEIDAQTHENFQPLFTSVHIMQRIFSNNLTFRLPRRKASSELNIPIPYHYPIFENAYSIGLSTMAGGWILL